MTTLTVLPLLPATSRDARAARARATARGGRARGTDGVVRRQRCRPAATPRGRCAPACASAGTSGVAVDCLALTASEPLAELGRRLEAMLHGAAPAGDRLSRADGATWASGRLDGEALIGDAVAPDDVVVLHDALAAVIAEAARERGAHVAWRVDAAALARPTGPRRAPGTSCALAPARSTATSASGSCRRRARGRIGSAMPSTGAVSGWDAGAGDGARRLEQRARRHSCTTTATRRSAAPSARDPPSRSASPGPRSTGSGRHAAPPRERRAAAGWGRTRPPTGARAAAGRGVISSRSSSGTPTRVGSPSAAARRP